MKRFHIINAGFCFAMLVMALGFAFSGCNGSPGTVYYNEGVKISLSSFNSVSAPGQDTFEAVKNYYNQYKSKSTETVFSGVYATEADIIQLLLSRGFTSNSANNIISALNNRGNIVMSYIFDGDSNYRIVLYYEKQ